MVDAAATAVAPENCLKLLRRSAAKDDQDQRIP